MKLNEKLLNVQISDNMPNKAFSIKTTAKAFKVLSEQLYSDKISAVIRELSTNAADAHIAAGKPEVPFVIHVPTKFESWFSVYDEGTGLSEDQITELYTTYFASDKTNSNDYTGCLGLGSKSPFAYCDSFSVISRFNNKKYIYTCYIGSDGIPNVVRMGDPEDTTEPNGLEVRIPVSEKDCSLFQSKASTILSWFKIKPIIKGMSSFVFTSYKYSYEGDCYAILENKSNYSSYNYYRLGNTSYVIMGNVAYPVHADDVKKASFSELEQKIIDIGVHLFVPIGSIEPTPGRESLSFTKETIDILHKYINIILSDLKKKIELEFDKAETLWEARKLVNSLNHPIIGALKDSKLKVEWKGQAVEGNFYIKKEFKASFKPDEQIPNFKIEKLVKNSWEASCRKIACEIIAPTPNTVVCLGDQKIGNYSRIYYSLEEGSFKDKIVIYAPDHANLRSILDKEGVKYILTSELPVRPKEKSTGGTSSYGKINEYVPTGRVLSDYWYDTEHEVEDGGTYVIINRGYYTLDPNIFENASKCNPYYLNTIINLLGKFGFKDKVYGIRPCDLEKVKKAGDWVSLKEKIEEIFNKNKDVYVEKIKTRDLMQEDCFKFLGLIDINKVNALPETSPFKEVIDSYNKFKKVNYNDINDFTKLAEMYNQDWVDTISCDDMKKPLIKIVNRYPMVQYLDFYKGRNSTKHLMDYIKMVDQHLENKNDEDIPDIFEDLI